MKKTLLFFAFVLPFGTWAQCPVGQSEVTIDVITDAYGYEAYWELLPGGNVCGTGTIFAGGNTAVGCAGGGAQLQTPGGYGNNMTISEGPWCLTQGNTYDINFVDDWGDAGIEFTVYIDSFPVYANLTGSGTPFTTLSFTASPPFDFDFEGEKISTYGYVNPGNVNIETEFFNRSSNTINSLDFNYQIDSDPVATQSIGLQTIAPFTAATYTHSIPWNASVIGTHTLKAWASNLNGNADLDVSNDTITKIITVGPAIPNLVDGYIGITPLQTIIANSSDGILVPRDLDFHPNLSRNELWVVLKGTEPSGGKTVKISNAGLGTQTELVQQDANAYHFMSLPTGIAFSENENFSTSPGVYDANHDGGTPFTGPTLWSSDPAIYAMPSGGNGSHLDMLHESPYSMGIAYESENKFWINDGNNNTIVSYDFADDHGPGNDDHSDGIIRRYTGLGLMEDPTQHVVSHVAFDKATGWLYIADTGNDRIVRLNTTTGSNSGSITPLEAVAEFSNYTGYTSSVYVSTGLTEPSGIDVVGDRMIVSDHTTGEIIIYDISGTSGVEMGRIPTGAPGIMGVKIGPDGKIWYVNAISNEVVRLEFVATGVDEFSFENLQIYPNPTNGNFITVSGLKESNTSIKIMNTIGELVLESIINAGSSSLDVSTLSMGTYIIQLRDIKSGILITKKLVVIK